MITIFSYCKKELKKENPENIEKLNLSKKQKERKWIIITGASSSEKAFLKEKVNLHPVTTEDILSSQTRIKYEEHEDYTVIIFKAIKKVNTFYIKTNNISMVFGESTLITVCDEENKTIDSLLQNETKIKYLLSKGEDFVGHYILDKEIDKIMDAKNIVAEDFKKIEKEFFRKPDKEILKKLFEKELILLELRQLSESTTDLCINLIKPTDNYIRNELILYFKDVYDHTFKTTESLKTMLGRISGMRNSYQSIISNKINDTMRILTIMTAIMMTMTIITGFYGMNIKLPFQDKSYSYILILGLMIIISIVTYFVSRTRRNKRK